MIKRLWVRITHSYHAFPIVTYCNIPNHLKMCRSRPLFLYCSLFYKQFTGNIGSLKVAHDWIQTADLWCRKRLLCQHNQCPSLFTFLKMGQSAPLFVYFCLFYMIQIKYILITALMLCLGLKPGAAGWKA